MIITEISCCQNSVNNGAKRSIRPRHSPSCGNSSIYDGSFNGQVIPGSGVTAQLLNDHGIKVFNELELFEADAYLHSQA
ncbi:DUF523 domain-containing protein [Legionella sp. CNM-4043-24]|uniref:DUF523 domain-containing protein n=1 Tax=Legionella sp. CNM-4043-24 TaxID=3421646 RepID=UPI00403AD601